MNDLKELAKRSVSRNNVTAVQNGNAPAVPDSNFTAIRRMVEAAQDKLSSVLPRHIKPDRMIRVAMGAIAKNERLMQCTPASIVTSLLTAAELGLDAGGSLGSAYLVPYRNSKTGRYECQLIAGYRGLIDLARRSGHIKKVEAHVVHEQDQFEISFGTESGIRHVPNLGQDPGKPIGVYAVATLTDGVSQWEFMTIRDVERIRTRSKSADSGPWVTDYDEMCRKTVVRRLMKYLPLSPELADALDLDDNGRIDTVVPIISEPVSVPEQIAEPENVQIAEVTG